MSPEKQRESQIDSKHEKDMVESMRRKWTWPRTSEFGGPRAVDEHHSPSGYLDISLVRPWAESPVTPCWTCDLQKLWDSKFVVLKLLSIWHLVQKQWRANMVFGDLMLPALLGSFQTSFILPPWGMARNNTSSLETSLLSSPVTLTVLIGPFMDMSPRASPLT